MSSDGFWRSYLYAPGNNPKLLERVYGAGADAVVLDLEDAVPWEEKTRARELVAEAVSRRADRPAPSTFVRVNSIDSSVCAEDIAAVVSSGLTGIRLAKVETPGEAKQAAAWIESAERGAGLPAGSIRLDCAIETAAGVLAAAAIAGADPRIGALSFGAVDFAQDVGAELTREGTESFHARSHLVLVSRAARVAPPIDSVYPWLDDPDGLARSVGEARRLGFGGKSTIHPSQLDLVHEGFVPRQSEIEEARRIVEAFEQASAQGTGAIRLEDGSFVDKPVVERAQSVLALAERHRDND